MFLTTLTLVMPAAATAGPAGPPPPPGPPAGQPYAAQQVGPTPAPQQGGPACPGADLVPAADNVAAVRDATLCLLNEQRRLHGMRPFAASPDLLKSAQGFSRMMVRERFFDHVSPGGSTLLSRVRRGTRYLRGARNYSLGENIAWGSGEFATPDETVKNWMSSSGHRANILNRRFVNIGVGVFPGAPEDTQGMPAATFTTDFGYRALRH